MGYFSSFNDGFNFNQLGQAIGLHGFKPMRQNFENSLGLHGFDKAGKAHGGNALGGLLLVGGSAALGAGGLGGLGGAGGGAAGGALGGAEAGASTGGLTLGGEGMGSGALINDGAVSLGGGATNYGAVDAAGASSPGFFDSLMSGGDASKMLSNANKAATLGQQAGLLGGHQQQMQQPQLNKQNPNFAGLLTQPQDNDAQRRQQYQQYVQNIGGGYGRFA